MKPASQFTSLSKGEYIRELTSNGGWTHEAAEKIWADNVKRLQDMLDGIKNAEPVMLRDQYITPSHGVEIIVYLPNGDIITAQDGDRFGELWGDQIFGVWIYALGIEIQTESRHYFWANVPYRIKKNPDNGSPVDGSLSDGAKPDYSEIRRIKLKKAFDKLTTPGTGMWIEPTQKEKIFDFFWKALR